MVNDFLFTDFTTVFSHCEANVKLPETVLISLRKLKTDTDRHVTCWVFYIKIYFRIHTYIIRVFQE